MLVRNNRKKIVIGNWKMNPRSRSEAKKIFQNISRKKITSKNVTVVVCPPALYLAEIAKGYKGNKIFFGAQDMFFEKEGAFTGEISAQQLQDAGARFVILGHSERRAIGETDELISKKVKAAIAAGMHAVLCVGEKDRDAEGSHLKFIEDQLRESLSGVSKKLTGKLIVAYEPVWAIGKGNEAMKPEDISRSTLFIRKILSEIFGRTIAQDISVIYGGSADEDNAYDIVTDGHVDGLLLGRASLHPDAFVGIINALGSKK